MLAQGGGGTVSQVETPTKIRPMREDERESVVRLWHETKLDAYPYLPLERDRKPEEDLAFFRDRIEPKCDLFVAEADGRLLGFLALNGSYVDRLYVHPNGQRRGIGSRLIQRAQQQSPGGLELHTHQKNVRACAFYEKHGFLASRYGVSPAPESEPDVEYHWRPGAGSEAPDGWTVERMRALGSRHAELEARRELEGVMATLVEDPVYEFHPVGLRMSGRAKVRRYYEELFSAFIPITRSYRLISEWASEDSLAQEYEIEVEVEGGRERHRVIGILLAEGVLLAGERVFASERCIRLMVGSLFDELEPLEEGDPP